MFRSNTSCIHSIAHYCQTVDPTGHLSHPQLHTQHVAKVATIARQKMMIFETWDWTKDQVWRVIGAIVLAMAPVVLISFLGVWVAGALTGLPVLGDAGTLATISPFAAFAFGVITGLFSIPSQLVGAALAVFMYRGFEPDRRTEQF